MYFSQTYFYWDREKLRQRKNSICALKAYFDKSKVHSLLPVNKITNFATSFFIYLFRCVDTVGLLPRWIFIGCICSWCRTCELCWSCIDPVTAAELSYCVLEYLTTEQKKWRSPAQLIIQQQVNSIQTNGMINRQDSEAENNFCPVSERICQFLLLFFLE